MNSITDCIKNAMNNKACLNYLVIVDLITPSERESLPKGFPLSCAIYLLRWENLEELGYCFIRSVHAGIAPGGPVAIIAVAEITKRAMQILLISDKEKPSNDV